MKLCVPSIGSMYQRTVPGTVLRAVFLADEAVVGIGAADPLADQSLDGRVGLGDERAVGLRLDDQVAAEMLESEPVRLVRARERER